MTKYAALLRGIAPTNPNMKNEKLRDVFESLGLSNVASVISSGNIIFETDETNVPELEQRIEKTLHNALGITCTTLIRSQEQLQQLIDAKPFGATAHTPTSYLIVTFLQGEPLKPLKFPEEYTIAAIYDREVCSIIDNTTSKKPDPTLWLEKNYGKEITTRTWLTVERIMKKMLG